MPRERYASFIGKQNPVVEGVGPFRRPGPQPREGRRDEGRAMPVESCPWREKPKRATRSVSA